MNFICNYPLFTIVLSLFSGVLCYVLKPRAAKIYTICVELLLIAMVICVLIHVMTTGQPFTYVLGEFPAPWGNESFRF